MKHDDHFALSRAPTPVLVAIVLALFMVGGSVAPQEDYSSEWKQSDLMLLDQRDDAHRKADINECKNKHGDGVAVRFDFNNVVSGCGQRRT
jgi:hypothetical protein